jgi:predicted ribosomally synthesized peptide with nif11-like leader
MSQQAVAQFLKRIDEDGPFREEFFKTVPKQLSNGAPIVEFAGLHGFEFTEDELRRAAGTAAGQDELSDAQMEAVAGGVIAGTPGDQSSREILRSFRRLGDNKIWF